MAISIDWENKIINVPKADTTLLVAGPPQEIRQLDLDAFRLALRALEASEDGMPFPHTHSHNTTVTISGAILARVVEIINGYTVTFEDGAYAVNLVGANSNVGDVVNVNQVSIRSANSAGLQDLSSLQAASYIGAITIDVVNGQPGVLFPTGTEGQPVDNLVDALEIAQTRGIRRFRVVDDLTIDQDVSNYIFFGNTTHLSSTITLSSVALTSVEFENCTVTGSGSGSLQMKRCKIDALDFDFTTGSFTECGLGDYINTTAGTLIMHFCYSEVPFTNTPYISTGTGGEIQLRGWIGGIELRDYVDGCTGSIDLLSGRIVLHNSCTGGDLATRSSGGNMTRNDAGAVNVEDQGFVYGGQAIYAREPDAPELYKQQIPPTT